MTSQGVLREERGWAGHFICAALCRFRRNTLLTLGDIHIVVSTVGGMRSLDDTGIESIAYQRYYETMAFESRADDPLYHDADTNKVVSFNSPWSISNPQADSEANAMHEAVVAEITETMERLRQERQ